MWNALPGSGGQHHGDSLAEQGRGDQVQEPGHEGPGDYSVISDIEDVPDYRGNFRGHSVHLS